MYLITPVEKTVCTNIIPLKALSTVIPDGNEVEPTEVNSYTVCKGDLKDITVSDTGRFKIEIWKYNPMGLARLRKHANKLSCHLSIRDKEDISDKIEMILAELQ